MVLRLILAIHSIVHTSESTFTTQIFNIRTVYISLRTLEPGPKEVFGCMPLQCLQLTENDLLSTKSQSYESYRGAMTLQHCAVFNRAALGALDSLKRPGERKTNIKVYERFNTSKSVGIEQQ